MILLLITMFNLLVEKAKKIMDTQSSTTNSSAFKPNPIVFDKNIDDVQLKETIFGKYWYFILIQFEMYTILIVIFFLRHH